MPSGVPVISYAYDALWSGALWVGRAPEGVYWIGCCVVGVGIGGEGVWVGDGRGGVGFERGVVFCRCVQR